MNFGNPNPQQELTSPNSFRLGKSTTNSIDSFTLKEDEDEVLVDEPAVAPSASSRRIISSKSSRQTVRRVSLSEDFSFENPSMSPMVASSSKKTPIATTTTTEEGEYNRKATSDFDKHQSLVHSASFLKPSTFLERKKTRGQSKEDLPFRDAGTSTDFSSRRSSVNYYYNSSDNEDSDFYEQMRPHSQMSRNDSKQSLDPVNPTSTGVVSYFLHVRHFTPLYNTTCLTLSAVLWSESGERIGSKRINLFNCKSHGCLNSVCMGDGHSFSPFHLVGEIKLEPPFRIGFLQLKKNVKFSLLKKQISDVFIQDAFLKPNVELSANRNILAYFRFTGYVNEGAEVLMRNLISREQSLTAVALIKTHALNKKSILQERLTPEIEWANTEGKPRSKSLYRNYQDVLARLEGLYEWKRSTPSQRPLLFNEILHVGFDPAHYHGAPGFSAFPPKNMTFSAIKFEEFFGSNAAADTLHFAKSVCTKSPAHHSAKQYCYIDFSGFLQAGMKLSQNKREIRETKRIVENFDTDEEFARQYVEGLFCTHLRLYCPPEENAQTFLHFTKSHLVNMIRQPNRDAYGWVPLLAQHVNASPSERLFFADYSKLMDIPRNVPEDGHFAPARVLFQLQASKRVLVPIAISLFDEDSKAWKTHTPRMASWSVAKLFVKCCAGQEHQMVSHALHTHLCVEPFAIALDRQVPMHHFLYKVLKPHFRYMLDLNFKAKTLLLNEGGRWDFIGATGGPDAGHLQFLLKHFKEWTIDCMCFPEEMKQRGFRRNPLSSEFELPDYMYAQDSQRLWNVISEWVSDLVDTEYGGVEARFEEDDILHHYFEEVQTFGFPNNATFHPQTTTELKKILSGVVFTATCQHAAVNFPQFAHYGFVANSPMILSQKAPEPDQVCSAEAYLPNDKQCLKAIQAVWGLSRFTLDDERFLLNEDRGHFHNLSLWNDPRHRVACEEMIAKLIAVEKLILNRGKTRYGTRYLWLLPSTIPTSITT